MIKRKIIHAFVSFFLLGKYVRRYYVLRNRSINEDESKKQKERRRIEGREGREGGEKGRRETGRENEGLRTR